MGGQLSCLLTVAPQAEVDPRMVPATVYSVGAHTRWQAMSQSTCPRTVPGKEYTPPSQWSALVLLLIPLAKLGLWASIPTTGEQTLPLKGL